MKKGLIEKKNSLITRADEMMKLYRGLLNL